MADQETILREELAKACKVLFSCGISDLVGHMSVRLDENHILVKPRPVSWSNLTPDELIVIDFEGNRVDGPATPKTAILEWPIHSEIYRNRTDVRSVLHAHPPHSTLMASLDIQMEPLTRELLDFPGGLPVLDSTEALLYHRTFIDTVELGQELASVLGKGRGVLLKHHGDVVVGGSIAEVGIVAYAIEIAAKHMLQAASIRSLPYTSEDKRRAIAAAWNRHPAFGPAICAERWEMMKGYYLQPQQSAVPREVVPSLITA